MFVVEMLAIEIRDCKDIKGIRKWSTVNDENVEAAMKITLYVNDITLF